jgi:mannose-6-phosphate isomerase-like protein (cupin superfamily)
MTLNKVCLTLSTILLSTLLTGQGGQDRKPAGTAASQAMSTAYDDAKWQVMVPELGRDSPQIAILRTDATTHATQLLIRIPKQMHIPMHWHSANETHTVIHGTSTFEHEGKREQMGPGGFNYIPARMHHQGWFSDDSLVFITVDSAWDVNWISGPPTKADVGKTP